MPTSRPTRAALRPGEAPYSPVSVDSRSPRSTASQRELSSEVEDDEELDSDEDEGTPGEGKKKKASKNEEAVGDMIKDLMGGAADMLASDSDDSGM